MCCRFDGLRSLAGRALDAAQLASEVEMLAQDAALRQCVRHVGHAFLGRDTKRRVVRVTAVAAG
jgi:hypothetical protein